MFGVDSTELLVIAVIALLVIGRQYWRRLVNRGRGPGGPGVLVPREKILT